MPTLPVRVLVSLGLYAAVLLSTGCTIARSYHVPDGAARSRSYTSIAGDVEVGRQATIGSARTVAGNIELHEAGRAGNLSSVSGQIHLAAGARASGSIKTVAGDIELADGCTVDGDVSTVAGHIAVTGSVITGNVTLDHGKLDLTRSRVIGTVRVRHSDREGAEIPRVTIGPGSEVTALVVEERTDVRLRIHRTAKVGSIRGAEAEYYD